MVEQSGVERLVDRLIGLDARPYASERSVLAHSLVAQVYAENDQAWLGAIVGDGGANPEGPEFWVRQIAERMGYEWRAGKWVDRDG